MQSYRKIKIHKFLLSNTILGISVFLQFTFANNCWGQNIKFEKLHLPLSHNTIYDITKDKDGLMWFATREGLNSYDSHSVKTYYGLTQKDTLSISLESSEISCLLSTKKGLYIGTSLGLNKYNKTTETFEQIKLINNEEVILTLYEDANGNIFVGTQNGLYVLDKFDNAIKIKNDVSVKAICEYKSNVYWIALNSRILLINNLGETIKEYTIKQLTDENITYTNFTLFKDSAGRIWLGSSMGLFYFDESIDEFKQLSTPFNNNLESNVIRKIAQDNNNNLWLGTESGIFLYNLKSKSIKHYGQSFNENLNRLTDKSIYSLYFDNSGIMWIGTYFGGVNFTKPKGVGFHKLLPGQRTISGKAISDIIEDNNGKLWIGTEDSGITIFDKKNGSFEYLKDIDGLSSNNIHSLFEDSKDNIWIGTYLGGLNKYSKKTKRITVYKQDKNSNITISNNYVYAILEDKNNKLWVGTQFGLNIYNYQTNHFSLFKPEVLGKKFIYDLLEDKKGNIWICTRYSGIYKYNIKDSDLQQYRFGKNGNDVFSSNQFISAYEDSKENIWFGSLNGGILIYDSNKKQFNSLTQEDGLPNNNAYGAIEDCNGIIWITTNNGLSKYNPITKEIINFNSEIGLSTNQFNFKSLYKDRSGWLYFGSIYGLNYFHPDSLNFNEKNQKIKLTSFKLFNKEVPISNKGVLKQNIDLTNEITLDYSENVITFEFTALNFESNNSDNYEYFLEGFENDWNKVGNKHNATYTNLSPGKYNFRVRTYPNSEATNERSVILNINPPFWKSNLAVGIYIILFFAIILLYTRVVNIMHKQKLAIQLERVEKEKISELNKHKLNFFTFISHEFKTPLTLIIASIERYFQYAIPSKEYSEELVPIKKSADKLRHLVQQLMEFRKIETDHAELNLKKGNVILFIKNNFEAFLPLLNHKGILYKVKSSFSEYNCFFDADKIEMIVTNLVSNAIKNTDSGGYIEIKTDIGNTLDKKHRGILTISLKDTGKGIPAEKTEQVLNPFYYQDHTSKHGSGIGLALVNSLTKYLEGSIKIDSKEGEGTNIIITIPLLLKYDEHKKIEFVDENSRPKIDIQTLIDINNEVSEEVYEKPLSNELRILIVEDNKELVRFLQMHFSHKFKVDTAFNGLDALNKIEKKIPDIIISDIKMPIMNGLSLCKKVKSNPKTSYIPFLLLTAQTEESDKLEALGIGADAYLTKPFILKELDLLVRNLLRSGQNLENRFAHKHIKQDSLNISNNQAREFIKMIEDTVENNYTDPSFTIETMATMIGISRSLLHTKMKKSMNLSASEYIKTIRLEKALDLMRQGYSISEVTYKVGYNDPNYFSRVFKKHFKKTPSSYLENLNTP